MSEKKRSLSKEDASDIGEELAEKRAKMAQNKTAISILYEMCQKVIKKEF